jgi:hypothetical protein
MARSSYSDLLLALLHWQPYGADCLTSFDRSNSEMEERGDKEHLATHTGGSLSPGPLLFRRFRVTRAPPGRPMAASTRFVAFRAQDRAHAGDRPLRTFPAGFLNICGARTAVQLASCRSWHWIKAACSAARLLGAASPRRYRVPVRQKTAAPPTCRGAGRNRLLASSRPPSRRAAWRKNRASRR